MLRHPFSAHEDIVLWTLFPALGTADAAIDVLVGNLPTMAFGYFAEFAQLILAILTLCADATVDDCSILSVYL